MKKLFQIFLHDTLYDEMGTFTGFAETKKEILKMLADKAKIDGMEYKVIEVKPITVMGKEVFEKDIELV